MLTEAHCGSEMQAAPSCLPPRAETRQDPRMKGVPGSVLTCDLCNNCLGNPPIGKKGFDFLFYHTAVPPNKNRRQDQQCMLKVEILIFAKKGEAKRWGGHRKNIKGHKLKIIEHKIKTNKRTNN